MKEVTISGISQANEQVSLLIDNMCDRLENTVHDIGRRSSLEARRLYATEKENYKDDYDVSVRMTMKRAKYKPGFTLQASGKSVLFLEFGAGMFHVGSPVGSSLGYPLGSWSKSPRGKGHWDDPNGWHTPKGSWTDGVDATRAMEITADHIVRQWERRAKEVVK